MNMIILFYIILVLIVIVAILSLWIHKLRHSHKGMRLPFASDVEMSSIYHWKLDSARNVKVQGELTLSFSLDYIDMVRSLNPYSKGVPSDNSYYVEKMVCTMHEHPELMFNCLKVVQYINRQCSKHSLYEYDRLQFVLDFVQAPNIEYLYDYDCPEIGNPRQYIRYPDETLYDKHGDCDCKSMLAATLFHLMGYKVLFLMSHSHEHAAIGLEYSEHWNLLLPDRQRIDQVLTTYNGKRYVFCETTSDGFRIGAISRHQSVEDFAEIVEI